MSRPGRRTETHALVFDRAEFDVSLQMALAQENPRGPEAKKLFEDAQDKPIETRAEISHILQIAASLQHDKSWSPSVIHVFYAYGDYHVGKRVPLKDKEKEFKNGARKITNMKPHELPVVGYLTLADLRRAGVLQSKPEETLYERHEGADVQIPGPAKYVLLSDTAILARMERAAKKKFTPK